MILFGMHEAYFYLILFRIFFNIIDDLNKVDFLRSFQDVFFLWLMAIMDLAFC